MRDKLTELITNLANSEEPMVDGLELWADSIADHLLANGVVVPPCYIGQEIWQITKYYDGLIEIRKGKVSMLQQKSDKSWKIRITVNSSVWDFTPNEIGTRYFFTREQAEKALAERKEQ